MNAIQRLMTTGLWLAAMTGAAGSALGAGGEYCAEINGVEVCHPILLPEIEIPIPPNPGPFTPVSVASISAQLQEALSANPDPTPWILLDMDNGRMHVLDLEAEVMYVGPIVDTDSDGIVDQQDNCSLVANPIQRDTNQDGFGNLCDPDFDQDGTVGLTDFDPFILAFGVTPVTNDDLELDGDGGVGLTDFDIFLSMMGQPPGPSGLACAGSIPCSTQP